MSPKSKKRTGKRYPLNMRTTKELRAALEFWANELGRSLAQEVEVRLERSFYLDAVMLMTHGPDANLIQALSTAAAMSAMLEINERPRALQVAAVHIIAALFELDLTESQQVRSVEWLVSTPFAIEGIKIADKVLKNIGAAGPIAKFEKITNELLAEVSKKNAGDLLKKQSPRKQQISKDDFSAFKAAAEQLAEVAKKSGAERLKTRGEPVSETVKPKDESR